MMKKIYFFKRNIMFYRIKGKYLFTTFDYNSDGLKGSQLHESKGNGEEARDVESSEALV